MRYDSTYQRLVAQVRIPDGQLESTGCWEWQGGLNNANYGRFSVKENGRVKKLYVHREMHRIVEGQYNEFDMDDDPLGPIFMVEKPALDPDDTVDHLCCFRRCGNPDHWIGLVSRAENTRLMQERKREHRLLPPTRQQATHPRGRRTEVDQQQRPGAVHPGVRSELPAVGRSLGSVRVASHRPGAHRHDGQVARARPHLSAAWAQLLRLDRALELANRALGGQRLQGRAVQP